MMKIYLYLVFSLLLSQEIMGQPYQVFAELEEKDLVLEGITYSEKNKTLYLSSVAKNKIVAVKDGKLTDFCKDSIFKSGVGLHVDDQRDHLWACAFDEVSKKAMLFQFGLSDGQMIKQYILLDTAAHFLNDLCISPDGDIYLTDTEGHSIYLLRKGASEMELFLKSEQKMDYPNGILCSKDGKYLFVAAFKNGIVRVDLNNKQIMPMEADEKERKSIGLDGLAWNQNQIIGIQNAQADMTKHKIYQFTLSKGLNRIENASILDENNPYFEDPTTCVVRKKSMLVIANSQLQKFNKNGMKTEGLEFKKPIVLEYVLK